MHSTMHKPSHSYSKVTSMLAGKKMIEKYFCQREGLIDKQNSHQYIIILRTKYNTKTKLTKGKLDLIIFYYKKFL